MDLKTFNSDKYTELKKEQNAHVKSYNSSRNKASKKKLWYQIVKIELELQKVENG